LKAQSKAAAIKEKFGESGKPAPVTVKTLDGQVLGTWDQSVVTRKGNDREKRKQVDSWFVERFGHLGFPTYGAYLRSRHWREIRSRYQTEREWKCRKCNNRTGLQLHHKTYARMGAELLDDLEPLCSGCHRRLHNKRRGS
jgi:5-methylcytosine-specific restriction endonuclease McrA